MQMYQLVSPDQLFSSTPMGYEKVHEQKQKDGGDVVPCFDCFLTDGSIRDDCSVAVLTREWLTMAEFNKRNTGLGDTGRKWVQVTPAVANIQMYHVARHDVPFDVMDRQAAEKLIQEDYDDQLWMEPCYDCVLTLVDGPKAVLSRAWLSDDDINRLQSLSESSDPLFKSTLGQAWVRASQYL